MFGHIGKLEKCSGCCDGGLYEIWGESNWKELSLKISSIGERRKEKRVFQEDGRARKMSEKMVLPGPDNA